MRIIQFLARHITTVEYLRSAKRISAEPSYYPEYPRKGRLRRIWEIFRWRMKTGDWGSFYNIYGFDVTGLGHREEDYLPYFDNFLVMRNLANGLQSTQTCLLSSQAPVLRDKYVFFHFMERMGVPTPRVVGVVRDGELCDSCMQPMAASALSGRGPLFVKDLDGECASFVKRIADITALDEYREQLSRGLYLVQEAIGQHPSVSAINPGCINTIRLATVQNHGRIEVFGAVMRFGTSKTGCVDNSAAGGICVGVDCAHGTLMKYGFYKPGKGTKTETHPDSGIVFEGYEIPFFKEAVALAAKAHRSLSRIHSIGWDIAITENGPVFIEGNDNWELKSMQASYGGLRRKWAACYPESTALPRNLQKYLGN